MNKTLEGAINKFVADRRKSASGGGWAEVTDEDFQDLGAIIEMLIESKCAPDADGDRPIRWRLIDRTKTHNLHFEPLVYDHEGTEADMAKARQTNFDLAFFNLGIAMGQLRDAKGRIEMQARFDAEQKALEQYLASKKAK